MRAVILFAVVAVATVSADSVCYKDAVNACRSTDKQSPSILANCNAKYGGIDHVVTSLQQYVNTHITRSFEYLLMSTHYANYQKNREGFEKMFRKLSDSKWTDAIDLIKYITKRGGKMDFNERKKDRLADEKSVYDLDELESMAKALDIEKDLAADVHVIHAHASRRDSKDITVHDPEITSYLEEHFAHKLSDNIRALSGHGADLMKLLSSQSDSSLSVYLFDEYLAKL